MDIKDRIKRLMEAQHMTQQVFADFLQQSPATLSSIFNGRTRPTLNVIDAIKTKIPDISIEWLLYGTGDMYMTRTRDSQEQVNQPLMEGQEGVINFDDPLPPTPNIRVSSPQMGSFQQGVKSTHPDFLREDMKIVDKAPRRVTEIRVYYDDQTYETFVPAKK
jgi:transcriptional regulator with XRE-family HTH domain